MAPAQPPSVVLQPRTSSAEVRVDPGRGGASCTFLRDPGAAAGPRPRKKLSGTPAGIDPQHRGPTQAATANRVKSLIGALQRMQLDLGTNRNLGRKLEELLAVLA